MFVFWMQITGLLQNKTILLLNNYIHHNIINVKQCATTCTVASPEWEVILPCHFLSWLFNLLSTFDYPYWQFLVTDSMELYIAEMWKDPLLMLKNHLKWPKKWIDWLFIFIKWKLKKLYILVTCKFSTLSFLILASLLSNGHNRDFC